MRKIIKQYIKWNWDWNLDSALRYQPLLHLIKNQRKNVIVEVGSGSRGISAYAGIPSFGVDIVFNSKLEPGLQQRVSASGDNLPFDNRSVDVVLCVDMLEHVNAELRSKIIAEMFRVVRREGCVFIAVPCGSAAEAADRRVHEAYLKNKGKAHPMLVDHIEHGLPNKSEMLSIVQSIAFSEDWSLQYKENTPIWLWEWNMMWFAVERWLPGLRHFQRILLQPLFFLLSRLKSDDNYRLILIATSAKTR